MSGGIPKRRTKSRTKSRSKSRSKPSSSQQLQPCGSNGPSDADGENMDHDLNDLILKIEGVEQRSNELLQSLQNEISLSANYMLDSIMAGVTISVDSIKSKIPQVQKMRQANRSIKTQLRVLDELDRA